MPLVSNPIIPGNIMWECAHCGKAFLMCDEGEKHEAKCGRWAREGAMILKKIDLFIGRHMSAKRWIAIWLLAFAGSLALISCGMWVILGIPLMLVSIVGVIGNVRRL